MNPPLHPSNNRILIIDDNPSIHDDIRKILTSAESQNLSLEEAKAAVLGETSPSSEGTAFLIDSALQGEEGLALVKQAVQFGWPYALAFVDMRMPPGWDGITTITHLWKSDPNLQVIICTAYSDYSWEEIVGQIGKSSNLVILKKPFDNIEVLQLAHALAEKWRLNDHVNVRLADLDRLVRQRTAELERANEQLKLEIAERSLVEQVLRQAQKMEAVGQLAAGVAHDFNNILTVIQGHISLLLESPHSSGAPESVREIRDSAERAASLVRQLLTFSRKQVIQPLPLDLGEAIANLGAVLRRVLGEPIALQVQCAGPLPLIEADLRMVEQAVINLAVNARDAMPYGGALTIAAAEATLTPETARHNPEARPGHFICLTVTDTGCGIAPDVLPRVFEPFFTTKDTGKGTGLGLASAYGIVKQHAGWIEVQSQINKGTVFRLFFPVCAEDRLVQVSPPVGEPVRGQGETILVVEDEPAVRRLAAKVLKRYGYRVYEAESGVEALKEFPKFADEVDLLLTDMVMPGGISGRELAQRLQKESPSLKTVFMTGYSQSITGIGTKTEDNFILLPKPFSGPDLLRIVHQCLHAAKPATSHGGGCTWALPPSEDLLPP